MSPLPLLLDAVSQFINYLVSSVVSAIGSSVQSWFGNTFGGVLSGTGTPLSLLALAIIGAILILLSSIIETFLKVVGAILLIVSAVMFLHIGGII